MGLEIEYTSPKWNTASCKHSMMLFVSAHVARELENLIKLLEGETYSVYRTEEDGGSLDVYHTNYMLDHAYTYMPAADHDIHIRDGHTDGIMQGDHKVLKLKRDLPEPITDEYQPSDSLDVEI